MTARPRPGRVPGCWRTAAGGLVCGSIVLLLVVSGAPTGAVGAQAIGAVRPGTTGAGTGAAGSGPAASEPLGYTIVTSAGQVATFGGALFAGDLATAPPSSPVVGTAATADHGGYWLAERDGAVLAFGDARATAPPLAGPPTVGIAADPATQGFFTVSATGQVRSVDAPALHAAPLPASAGAAVGLAVAGTVSATAPGTTTGAEGLTGAGEAGVGAAVDTTTTTTTTTTGGVGGVWVATANGDVVAVGTVPAVRPPTGLSDVVGIAATPDGGGYWLVTAAGVVAAAGDAVRLGAAPPSTAAAVGLIPSPDGQGALLVRSDGSVQPLGDAIYLGDAQSPLHPPLYPKKYELPPTGAVGGEYLVPGPQAATTGPLRVAFLGDSLSVITGKDTRFYVKARRKYADVWVADGGILGCGITGGLPLAVYSDPGSRVPQPTLPACAQWEQQYLRTVALTHPNAVVLLLGYWESQRQRLPPYGVVTDVDSAAYRSYLAAQLRSVNDLVTAGGARLVVMTAPPYGDGTPLANVAAFNQLLRAQAASTSATVFNLGALLGPSGRYTPVVDHLRVRTSDRVHLTRAGVERVIDPALVPVMVAAARADRQALEVHQVVGDGRHDGSHRSHGSHDSHDSHDGRGTAGS